MSLKRVYYYCYIIEIFPIIIQEYQIEVEATLWGQGKCVEFLQQVAEDLSEKVTARIADLNSCPEQLRIPLESEKIIED